MKDEMDPDTALALDPNLVCPITKQSLAVVSRADLEREWGAAATQVPRLGQASTSVGATDSLLVRADRTGAFPVLDGFPVLMGPEELVARGAGTPVDLAAPTYAEVYAEMEFYNAGDVHDPVSADVVNALIGVDPASFPADWSNWLDARYDCRAQDDCYKYLGPMSGRVALQMGGAGLHAVKFLLAGARQVYLVTPMITEARRGRWLAEQAGVADRLCVVLGIAEELPLLAETVDAVFAGGCVHHMVMHEAMPEIHRILTLGGAFAAAEPWRAPLYTAGTKVFGKREANAHCTPLTSPSVQVFRETFRDARVTHHGALLRYPLLALAKLGLVLPLAFLFHLFAWDDRASDAAGIRRYGSSVSLTGGKQHPLPSDGPAAAS